MLTALVLLITILLCHTSHAKNNFTFDAIKNAKTRVFLDLAVDMIAKAKDHLPETFLGLNDTLDITSKAHDCKDLQKGGISTSGVYSIWLENSLFEEKRLNVYCDMTTDGGGWTVIQRRGSYSTPIDYFYREWYSYKDGFGDIQKEFWLGNDNIRDLTSQKLYSIRFDLQASTGEKAYAHYNLFRIDEEHENYTLHIKHYSGNAGDAMVAHDGQKFSTKDRDNDNDKYRHCAHTFSGGWWYNSCLANGANLNGFRGSNSSGSIARWVPLKDEIRSLDVIEIKIRPSN